MYPKSGSLFTPLGDTWMKRPLQLPLAIALALGGTNALALGLGPVHVKSKLNQPLDAEIPVIQGTAGEAEGLLVNLAAAEDFDRVGINRSRLTVPLEFSIVKGPAGAMVIKVTSKEAVRDTYLDFLVEANWPNGRMLREYTVLLDPPLTAPATHAATTGAVATTPRVETQKYHEAPPTRASNAARPASTPEHAIARTTLSPAPAPRVIKGQYGPVEGGETLSGIARSTRAGSGANVDQMMLALLKNNPNAFYKDNINALKRGAILRLPSADEIKAIGSVSEAAAQVHAQIEDWRGGRASPTLVADAGGTAPASASKQAKSGATAGKPGSERLELVPPKAGRDSLSMADRPGSGAGSAAATSELKSELARTKETLTTRDQETGELKSRVRELEDLKNKNDRLIGLKDSEIADLQQKLKQLQEKPPVDTTSHPLAPAPAVPGASTPRIAPAVVPPAVVPPASAPIVASATPAKDAKIGKDDIWGDAGSAAPATSAGSVKPTPVTAATPPPKPAAGMTETPLPAAGATTTPPASPPLASGATTTPLQSTSPTSVATNTGASGASTATKSTTAAPTRAATNAGVHPAPMAAPWYEASWLKPAALGAGILLLLAGLLGLRKRNAAPAGGRASLADSFGVSPLEGGSAGAHSVEAEEAELREHLKLDPANIGLHLELLSLYYAERDVARFEDAAIDMHAQVVDPHEPEWLEAQAMGQELAPNNPLFANAAHYDDNDTLNATAHTVTAPSAAVGYNADAHGEHDEAVAFGDLAPHRDSELHSRFDLDRPDVPFVAPAMPTPAARAGDRFEFDNLADVSAPTPAASTLPGFETPLPPPPLDDDYFAADDAIGTKLDLAKAYMDMGDPEGARSMLEEVVAEGNEAQQAEAQRLIADIH